MQVRDVMSAPPVFVYRESPLWRAARAMEESNCGFVPVVHHGVALGVITSGDLARAVALKGRCPYSTPVSEAMTSPPVRVLEEADVHEACAIMHDRRVRRIIVVDVGGILRGIVSLGDLKNAASDGEIVETLHHLAATSGPVASATRGSWEPEFFLV